jgi:hypothetical protein
MVSNSVRYHNLVASMNTAYSKGDMKAVAKWALELAELAQPAQVPLPAAFASVTPATPMPNPGASNKQSSVLYGAWVYAWLRSTFPDAFPLAGPVKALEPSAIVEAATAAGCLAQVCAAGTLGNPDAPAAPGLDWSLFTGLVGTGDGPYAHNVYVMGKLVATTTDNNPNGDAFAAANGIDMGVLR